MRIVILKVSIAFTLLSFLSACIQSDSDLSPLEETRKLLQTGRWSVKSIQKDGVERNDLFTGLKLKFEDSFYNPTNGGVLWGNYPISWSLRDNPARSFAIGTGPLVIIERLDKHSLTVRVNWDPNRFSGGTASLEGGLYVFNFSLDK